MIPDTWTDAEGINRRLERLGFNGILSIDLEGIDTINAIGAVRTDTSATFSWRGNKRQLPGALKRLAEFAEGAELLLGHNIIEHDLKMLARHNPRLRLLSLPAIDTLYLSPLAFPKNPYHRLVKQYKDPGLARVQANDPLLDAELTLELLADIAEKFRVMHGSSRDRVMAYHALLASGATAKGLDIFFRKIRGTRQTPHPQDAEPVVRRLLAKSGCRNQASEIADNAMADLFGNTNRLAVAYLLAWLPEAGGNSVIPPYVEFRFQPSLLADRLRMTHCGEPDCSWCSRHLDPDHELKRYFGFDQFKARPRGPDGESLQRSITSRHLAGKHLLGILPTGTGKSLCYQLPALVRHHNTGALTVVFSPLVALMADQVAGMEKAGITTATTINGLISMPERAAALEKVRLGDASIVLIAPEQLRNRSFREAIAGRHIGAWVVDEAHCLSKWGHDFRPDYRYIAQFISESHSNCSAPLLCLTATAKPDVAKDILGHFYQKLGLELELIDGGAERTNLEFAVTPTSNQRRITHIHETLKDILGPGKPGGGIVYCRTRRSSEETSEALNELGLKARHFHSGLTPEEKRFIQADFHEGRIDVVVATNAFGMGIDKPDVRVVVHAEIPGSLESYLQEAGRAGRDNRPAYCVLLFDPDDTERQFALTARSRLKQRDIQTVHRAIKSLEYRRIRHDAKSDEPVVATSGEILLEDKEGDFARDSATDDDRVRTAIAWLEESALVKRDENRTSIFPSSLRIPKLEAARSHVWTEGKRNNVRVEVIERMVKIIARMIQADPDIGISTDELMECCGCTMQQLRQAFSTMQQLGVASNDIKLTAYVHAGVENPSKDRLRDAIQLEKEMISMLREEAPDLEVDQWSRLELRPLAERLRSEGLRNPIPQRLARLLRSLSMDGRDEPDSRRSLEMRNHDMDTVVVRLRRDWPAIEGIAERRRTGAACLLDLLLSKLPSGARGVDLLVAGTYGELENAIKNDPALAPKLTSRTPQPLVDRALLWMHEQEVLTLNHGMTVFRPAMSLKVKIDGRVFTEENFQPLQEYYDEQTVQVHVVNEYAKLGTGDIGQARTLAADYFKLDNEDFFSRWFGTSMADIRRDVLPDQHRLIVEDLRNRAQQQIVADKRVRTNVLVLAGPGSGKTRVLVHRIAYLIRVRREDPRNILALTYNRHAAVEVKRRLRELIGTDAYGVGAMTCHALAMQIIGRSFAESTTEDLNDNTFEKILLDATSLLQEKVKPASLSREQILGRLEWILVDEYQDIGELEYELIAALAGKALEDDGARLHLFAVGDDDQNIYSFKGASVRYIRRFAQDYGAKEAYLLENYRSTGHIIDASNRCIKEASERLKRGQPLRVDDNRAMEPPGGDWAELDGVASGKVQILKARGGRWSQAAVAIEELLRLSRLDPDWRWDRCAVIARNWDDLDPVYGACRVRDIPAQMAREEKQAFWRARETQRLLRMLRTGGATVVGTDRLRQHRLSLPDDYWSALLAQALDEFLLDEDNQDVLQVRFVENWLAEWGREVRRKQFGLLLTSAHRAKGLEFDHVVILDGNWNSVDKEEDADAPRRLLYVAMTRARQTLTIVQLQASQSAGPQDPQPKGSAGNRLLSLLQPLGNAPSVLVRDPPEPDISRKEFAERIMHCSLKDVFLSYPGLKGTRPAVRSAIERLKPGDKVTMTRAKERWTILDGHGNAVGRMAKNWDLPEGTQMVHSEVLGVFVWRKEDTDANKPDFQLALPEWEVVVPKLVLTTRS